VLEDVLLAANFKLVSELISIWYLVVRKEFFGSTMFNEELSAGLNWHTNKRWSWTIWRKDLPNSVIISLGTKANLLLSWESSKYFWGALGWVEVKRLVQDVRVSYETYRLSICNNICWIWIFSALNINNWPTARSNCLFSGCASISLISPCDLVIHIEYEAAICLFIHQHNIIFASKLAISVVTVRHSLESFSEFLLDFIDQ